MKLGVLSDAHGNPLALEVCLEALVARRVDRLVFLGDAVGYLSGDVEVVDRLAEAGAICLMGNHEAMMLGLLPLPDKAESVYRLRRARARLGRARLSQLSALDPKLVETIEGSTLMFVHGSPDDPLAGYLYPETDLSRFAGCADTVFVGHTHRPFDRQVGSTRIINVGSCGLPRDVGDTASVCFYETVTGACELLRVPFDVDRVLRQCAEAPPHESVVRVLRRRPAGTDYREESK